MFWFILGTCKRTWVICDSACKSSMYRDTVAGSTHINIPLPITAQLACMLDSHGASTEIWRQHTQTEMWDLIYCNTSLVYLMYFKYIHFSSKKNHILYICVLHSIYILYTASINLDYLLDYLSILCTVSNNSNVGMGNNSQYIHFTISTRIHSLVIHGVTVELKRQLYIF